MRALLCLIAEQPPPQSDAPWWFSVIAYAPLFLIAYFLVFRAPLKQEQEKAKLLSNLKKNDRVLTTGGLIGIIVTIKDKDDEVLLKVDDNSPVKLRFKKDSIVKILSTEETAK